jgi:hypothetical protein
MISRPASQEIACQQILAEDASVFSVQWTDLPDSVAQALSSEALLERYLEFIRKYTLTLIRPKSEKQGIEFRLIGTNVSLISFLPPEHAGGHSTLRICGGFLVQPRQCDRGELRFGVECFPESIRVSLQLSDYCPLILGSRYPSVVRYWLYRFTQAAIHRLVTVRFLRLLYQELAGSYHGFRVVNVVVRSGKPV